jgi:uncharacterized protein YjbI with pentapeptide repeats
MSEEETVAPDPIKKFAQKAHDLDAARKSVEDAASVTTGLWLSYLFLLVYIGIAVGAVTHKDLFLEKPVKLPFVSDVPLPLVAFFILAPIVFIVSHAYTLVHFVMLASKIGVFNRELTNQLGNAAGTKEYLRWQLPANIFVQLLAGPEHLREGRLGFIANIIAAMSLVIGPILLLLLIQVQFLPFHSEWITWWHRILIVVDVVLLCMLWPTVVDGGSKIRWLRSSLRAVYALSACAAIGLAITAATFPGEWQDEHVGNKQWIPANLVPDWDWLGAKDADHKPKATSFHDLLFNGAYDAARQRRKSLFSNTLVLPGFDVFEGAETTVSKLGFFEYSFTRKNGHFEGAIFESADLRKINLENAYLQGASLLHAKLQGAQFYNANLDGAELYQAKLQGASLNLVRLNGAGLSGAELQGAYADGAELEGAELTEAKLQGASFKDAQLQGASFLKSSSAGTNMRNVALWRTSFDENSPAPVYKESVNERGLKLEEFVTLKANIVKEVPDGEQRAKALNRIEVLNPDMSGNTTSLRQAAATGGVADKALKENLQSLACSDDEDALYIVRGLVSNDRIKDTGIQAPALVDAILKTECPVFAYLTDADKAVLKTLKTEARARESKP